MEKFVNNVYGFSITASKKSFGLNCLSIRFSGLVKTVNWIHIFACQCKATLIT